MGILWGICFLGELVLFLLPTPAVCNFIALDIGDWNAAAAKAVGPRFWDIEDIVRSSSVVNFTQTGTFFEKIKAGKAVTVLAFGDSITSFGGGCYQRDADHIKQYVPTIGPAFFGARCREERTTMGWLSIFMHMINTTWPHPDHILINDGIPGHSLGNFAESTCIEPMLPSNPDLIILEHLPYLEEASRMSQTLELLIHRLKLNFNTSTFPPTILVNMHELVGYQDPKFQSIRDCLLKLGEKCDSACTSAFKGLPNAGNSNTLEVELKTDLVASHYGMTSLSYGPVLRSIVDRQQQGSTTGRASRALQESRQMSECQVFTSLFLDQIHPTLVGELLLADLLVNYLAGAMAHFTLQNDEATATRTQSHGAVQEVTSSQVFSSQQARELPLPLHAASLYIPVMRCFGTNGDHSNSPEGFHPSETLKVIKSDGWQLVREENGKFKPGWVSTTPGSVLRISMTSQLSHVHGISSTWQQQEELLIGITFLKSYEHMGVAEVSCMSGCKCANYTYDGHEPLHHHSIPFTVDTPGALLPHALKCIVQVMVSSSTLSGEYKVKVTQASLKTWLNISSSSAPVAQLAAVQLS
ncbi:hypothetical protein CEUSTIGMA_g11463.t1 [Chlamydomonas eustigma]|uniref:SGNH hydrolase-type esterase domain-containing protein n=1 Tax=Chlamydomonas eustigma TaxID=1157962 RepID=A0A250XM93_9CHLO|nr:hypothetical protein CEUSTIGMA_g11463.t1 [Chlamydomonas eustigma]|eukprot:GAX84039.1 hypothetical protein CEUSTIGMA_g11463.t1 [Chlamydomonas eustigma]